MKITCVCKHCSCHAKDDEVVMEINFINEMLYYVCPQCRKDNTIELHPKREPLPRTKLTR